MADLLCAKVVAGPYGYRAAWRRDRWSAWGFVGPLRDTAAEADDDLHGWMGREVA